MFVAVGGILEKDNKFLLVQEAKKDFYGKWNLPAGHLEEDETIIEGAEREILEETGFKTKVNGVVQISNDKNILVGITFSVDILSEVKEYKAEEILNTKWFTYDEIINMRDELGYPDYIINSIKLKMKNKIIPLENVLILEEDE